MRLTPSDYLFLRALQRPGPAASEVEMELELAQKQRELLKSIEEQIAGLPIEAQAEMLKHVRRSRRAHPLEVASFLHKIIVLI